MQIPTLLRFEELGADRHGRPFPPQTAKQVGPARCLPDPAVRGEVGCVPLKVEAIATGRDRLVPSYAFLCWVSAEVEIERRVNSARLRTYRLAKIADCVTHGQPFRQVRST